MELNILGFGVMGKQICALLQLNGCHVNVWSRTHNANAEAAYQAELKIIGERLGVNKATERVTHATDIGQLKANLTIEALGENLTVKKEVLGALPYSLKAIELFSNTSTFSPKEIYERCIGLHFFNPVYSIRVCEITCDPKQLSAEGRQLVSHIQSSGIEVVTVAQNRGYVGNYLLLREIASTLKLIDSCGYDSTTIDRVLLRLGRMASIFDVIDVIGVDVVQAAIKNLQESDRDVYISPLLEKAKKANILGKKNNTSIRSVIDR